jgi:hypothetical protein
MRLSILPLVALSILSAVTSQAQLNESSALAEVEFSRLSQQDPNPLGEKALAINPEQWKHGETEHFIYHFFHDYIATRVSVEAEFFYRVVAKELERDQPAGETKSHVYIFERSEDWSLFQHYGNLEPWTGGIQSQGSLFMERNPRDRFGGNVLGHEIVHLVLHRIYADGVPLWLNEGMAQYISKSAHASYKRARGYIAKPRSQAIDPSSLIPLSALVAMSSPPKSNVPLFYDQSERLVSFLANTDKPSFLALLDALGHHRSFESALPLAYAGKFSTVAILQEQFREYATKDFGSTLQDQRLGGR